MHFRYYIATVINKSSTQHSTKRVPINKPLLHSTSKTGTRCSDRSISCVLTCMGAQSHTSESTYRYTHEKQSCHNLLWGSCTGTQQLDVVYLQLICTISMREVHLHHAHPASDSHKNSLFLFLQQSFEVGKKIEPIIGGP